VSGYALLFPGQGAQHPGMGKSLAQHYAGARSVYEAADECLGYPISTLCFEGDADALRPTSTAQPAIAVTSLAALAALEDELGHQVAPVAVAGHSLGEYTATIAAGALTVEAGLRLIAERGRLMQAAAEARPGAMAAVLGIDSERCADACAAARSFGQCVVANDNAPGQQVISGDPPAVARAAELAKQAGARRVVPLAVAGAFHSEHMRSAEEALRAALTAAGVGPARWPVIGNVGAGWLMSGDDILDELGAQMTSPVRWRSSMESMCRAGIEVFVELGPGNVLAGLAKRCVPSALAVSVSDEHGVAEAADLLRALDGAR